MASKLLLLFTLLSFFHHLTLASFEFQVGEGEGWAVPPSDNMDFYNEWASKNRFQIGDTVVFEYRGDSVMVVTEDDYEQCNSLHPLAFYNGGRTVYVFNQSGPFYFISGTVGHCEKGQKMIIRVLGHDASPPPNGGDDTPTDQPSSASRMPCMILTTSQLAMLFLGFTFHQLY